MKFGKLFLIFFTLCASAHASPYFAAETIKPTLISSPFKKGSAEWKKEISEIIEMQKNPDPREIEQAKKEFRYVSETLVLAVDESLSREKFPKLYAMLDRAGETSHAVNDQAKNYYDTKRPYLSDKRVKALIEAHSNPSYPSGHTCGSYTTAHIMALLVAQKRDQFYARAKKIAWHRALTGMHFPNDLDGGREMALLVVGGLLQNKDFQKDFSAAQQELRGLK